MKYVVALDQGTTSSRAIVYNQQGAKCGGAAYPITQYFPQLGWVEHDPLEIFEKQVRALKDAVAGSGVQSGEVAAIGITNQRETVVLWHKVTGQPLYNAIVWQCRRTAPLCKTLEADGYAEMIHQKTGLVVDAYFSGTKLRWLLDNVPNAREMAARGELLAGTIDTWLVWKLTGGKVHITDTTNAARTMLFNIHSLTWDDELLALLDIPKNILPQVRSASEVYGMTEASITGFSVPIAAVVGDQHAALFGQGCLSPGDAKNTYGTGCFVLQNTGNTPIHSPHGLLTTIAWTLGGQTTYALEGSVFIGGALLQWFRDELGLIASAAECDTLALTVETSNGAYIVPAFVGLGTPYWDMDARGVITGLTRGVTKAHLCRAALEAIAFQVYDVLTVMAKDSGIPLQKLRVDGGASVSTPLLRFQADLCGVSVVRPRDTETTAMGAAMLAGLAAGVWPDTTALEALNWADAEFLPSGDRDAIATQLKGWHKAVERAKHWVEDKEIVISSQ